MKRRKKRSRSRPLPLTDELRHLLERQREHFRETFGREPAPTDPVWFDPDTDELHPLDPDRVETDIVRAVEQAGIDPALIYAYWRTGRMVTQDTMRLLSPSERAEWDAALEEYEALRARRN
jgi:hypothetical protein